MYIAYPSLIHDAIITLGTGHAPDPELRQTGGVPDETPAQPASPASTVPAASASAQASAQVSGDGAAWLLLIYRIPSEPTRLRATVWRRLKGLGAVYLQNSVAALPAGSASERALRKLRREILDMGGTAQLLASQALAGQQDILGVFQAARDDEYEEIVDKCQDFHGQLQKEYDAGHYTYAELEENEEDLVKLRNWLAKITERDVFGAPRRAATLEAIASCELALEEYAARVYAEEAEGH